MRALGFGLARARVAQRRDMAEGLANRRLEIAEVDRLGKKIEGAAVHRGADVGHVAVSRDDHRRVFGRLVLQFAKQRQPVHPRHVDVGDHHVEIGVIFQEDQSLDPVAREAEGQRTVADLPAEFLRDQILQIGLVVDDQDFRGHVEPVAASRLLISSRSPGKSIGLVSSPAAPPSIARRRVSASP